jgi:hypothetical protein
LEGIDVSRGLRWLLVAVVLLGLANITLVIVSREPEPPDVSAQAGPQDRPAARPLAPKADEASFEEIVLVCQLPGEGEPLLEVPGSGHGPSCPTTTVSALLGIAIASPHGIKIGSVVSGGAAARAGILPGDGITKCDGEAVSCPSRLLPYLDQAEERRPVELTVKRPIRPTDGPKETDEPDTASSEADEQSSQ